MGSSCGGSTAQRAGYRRCSACGRVLRDKFNPQLDAQIAERSIFNHLCSLRGPSTDTAIAAVFDMDLRRAQSALACLVVQGLVLEQGWLYVVPWLAA